MSKPEKTFRIGSCSASVFVNTTDSEPKRTFRTVTIQRRYKDGDEWKSATNFSLSELPQVAALAQLATEYLANVESEST